jgi:hypothetical protein
MFQSIQSLCIPMSAIALMSVAGTAAASNGSLPSEEVVEWVEISIHMPDGRVIKTQEPRYPSRSRVHIKTGKLPPFKAVQSSGTDGVDEPTIVELANEGDGNPNGGIESGGDVVDLASGLSDELTVDVADVNETAVVIAEPIEEPVSSGAVRQFKKSS